MGERRPCGAGLFIYRTGVSCKLPQGHDGKHVVVTTKYGPITFTFDLHALLKEEPRAT